MIHVNNASRKLFVRFLFPGTYVSEETERQVDHDDPAQVELPPEAYGFEFFSRIHASAIEDGKTVELTGGEQAQPGLYYPGGKIYSIGQIEATFGHDREYDALIDNMQTNGWPHVVQTCTGLWRRFRMGIDHIVLKTPS